MITRSSLARENNGIPQTRVALAYTINPFGLRAGRVSCIKSLVYRSPQASKASDSLLASDFLVSRSDAPSHSHRTLCTADSTDTASESSSFRKFSRATGLLTRPVTEVNPWLWPLGRSIMFISAAVLSATRCTLASFRCVWQQVDTDGQNSFMSFSDTFSSFSSKFQLIASVLVLVSLFGSF